MTTSNPRSLLVLAFDSKLAAQEAYLAMSRLQQQEVIVLHDAVFLSKNANGKTEVTETIDPTPGNSALRGGLWGALLGTLLAGPIGTLAGAAASAGLGALSAKLIDIGIPDATVRELEQAVTPGSSALALLVTHVRADALERELTRFAGATLVRSDLPPETVERLRAALVEPNA
jgi:uncharacterized membrane protein